MPARTSAEPIPCRWHAGVTAIGARPIMSSEPRLDLAAERRDIDIVYCGMVRRRLGP
jgi:hypothetical protein